MILKILRWTFGHIIILVKGKRIPEFINKIAKNKIVIWDIAKTGDALYFKTLSSEYNNILKISKTSGTKIIIEKKKGLPFFYLKYKLRFGFFIGFFIFLSLINIFSLYIWVIKIDGLKYINKQQVDDVLEEIGIYPGAIKKNIEPRILNQIIMEKLPSTAWVSVNIEGCSANVLIKEKLNSPELVEYKKLPKDIKASRDGQIERMETYQGSPIVKVGDSVTKDQILITSKFFNEPGEDFVKEDSQYSDGKVWAKTIHKINEKIINTQKNKIKTGKHKNIYKFYFLDKIIKLNFWENPNEQWELNTYIKDFKICKIELPFKFYNEEFLEYTENEIEISKEEAISNAKKNTEKIINSDEFKNVQILEKEEKIIRENNDEILETTLKCFENIALYKVN